MVIVKVVKGGATSACNQIFIGTIYLHSGVLLLSGLLRMSPPVPVTKLDRPGSPVDCKPSQIQLHHQIEQIPPTQFCKLKKINKFERCNRELKVEITNWL